MNRSEVLEDVLALLRDLDKVRDSNRAAADFRSRKEAVLKRVHETLDGRDRNLPTEDS